MLESQEKSNNVKKPPLPMGEDARRAGEGNLDKSIAPHPNPLPKGEGSLRVALVHDFLLYYGGAEKVLEALAEMFPEAPIYTLLYDKEKMRGKFEGKDIRTSFLQKMPKFIRKHYQWLLPFYGTAVETFNLREYDLVISSSSAWSKGIVTKLNAIHIAYVHSPMRFVWDYNEKYIKENRKEKIGFIIRPFMSFLRIWDRMSAERPDYLIANSKYTQERIRKYYRRKSCIIYPPAVDVGGNKNFQFPISNFQLNPSLQNSNFEIDSKFKIQNSKFFLIVSRLSPYKKVDMAVEAFNKLGLPLVVIGAGNQEKYLRKIAADNVKILGWRSEKKLAEYYQNARAFIFPGLDDFGITAVEAMSYGLPVIAIRKGGTMETVIEKETGLFFDAQTPEILADAVRRFIDSEDNFDRKKIKRRAEEFSKEKFKDEFFNFVNKIETQSVFSNRSS